MKQDSIMNSEMKTSFNTFITLKAKQFYIQRQKESEMVVLYLVPERVWLRCYRDFLKFGRICFGVPMYILEVLYEWMH